MKEAGGNSSKTTGAEIGNATTISMAERANGFSADNNRACSNEGSRKNKCSNDIAAAEDRVGTTQSICYGDRQREELLHLWRIQAHGP